ncbi:hypothetical protein [Nonomuraea candida]|uniref:hypothetical protein n=1 Tax=Nonomuraea candida TaxID=359159 RepID=UPI0012FACE2D|nr:hypothetical protein [Nonomuraea candida]
MIRAFIVMGSALAVLSGLAPAASAAPAVPSAVLAVPSTVPVAAGAASVAGAVPAGGAATGGAATGGAATGGAAAGVSANPPFCKGVKPCVFGGDAGVTWVHASASSAAKARKAAARLQRNAKAVHRRYGAPEWVDIHVIRKGKCWRRYGSDSGEPSRACTYKHVERKLS